jgi:hypothetical protein
MQKIRRQEGIMGTWSDLKEGVKVVGRSMFDKTKSAEAKPVEKAPPAKPFASIGSTEKALKDRGVQSLRNWIRTKRAVRLRKLDLH